MKVMITAAQRLLFDGEAKEVILPGEDGEFSVLDFHQACIYSLRQGQIKTLSGGKNVPKGRYFIKRGVALVEWGQLSIIAEEF
jgi:F-type H+-transporting ATPase subunit epsilon